jgi:hypothetical protein
MAWPQLTLTSSVQRTPVQRSSAAGKKPRFAGFRTSASALSSLAVFRPGESSRDARVGSGSLEASRGANARSVASAQAVFQSRRVGFVVMGGTRESAERG